MWRKVLIGIGAFAVLLAIKFYLGGQDCAQDVELYKLAMAGRVKVTAQLLEGKVNYDTSMREAAIFAVGGLALIAGGAWDRLWQKQGDRAV